MVVITCHAETDVRGSRFMLVGQHMFDVFLAAFDAPTSALQQAKLGICNVFGSAETLSLDFAGAPTSFSVSDLTKVRVRAAVCNSWHGRTQHPPSTELQLPPR